MKFLKPLALSLSTLSAAVFFASCSDSDTDFEDYNKNTYSFLDGTGTTTTDPAQAVCVLDSATNLAWEIKRPLSLSPLAYRANNKTFTWYDDTNNDGTADEGSCGSAISCDTSRYVQALQSDALCGLSNWRLPTQNELATILTCTAPNCDADEAPQINTEYFPNTRTANFFWASESISESTDPEAPGFAGMVSFISGELFQAQKSTPAFIRAVSPAQ